MTKADLTIDLAPGSYVVAVSGGVDSMVLLDVLCRNPALKLTVAHYDHGIRPESADDAAFVKQLAESRGLHCISEAGHLGPGISEDRARRVRYEFLHRVCRELDADAIITAHHADDVLETAVINLVRGTGRKGMSSLRSTDAIKRPLLHVPKSSILKYAQAHGIKWHEDATNNDTKYLRNHIRHNALATMQTEDKRKLYGYIYELERINRELDQSLRQYMQATMHQDALGRRAFLVLPHVVALEVLAGWLRLHDIRDFDRKTLERLVHAAKIRPVGRRVEVAKGTWMEIQPAHLALKHRER